MHDGMEDLRRLITYRKAQRHLKHQIDSLDLKDLKTNKCSREKDRQRSEVNANKRMRSRNDRRGRHGGGSASFSTYDDKSREANKFDNKMSTASTGMPPRNASRHGQKDKVKTKARSPSIEYLGTTINPTKRVKPNKRAQSVEVVKTVQPQFKQSTTTTMMRVTVQQSVHQFHLD